MREQLTMQQTQEISLEILRTVADICEAQNLRYALIYGTLIGAIRHHDYIPWDDDVDIMMPRPDYDKLLAYLDEHIGEYPNLKVFNRQTCSPSCATLRISSRMYRIRPPVIPTERSKFRAVTG